MESAPSVFISDKGKDNNNKSFELKFNNNIYLLTISLKNDDKNESNEKILNFNLKEKFSKIVNNDIFYESNQNINDLAKLFLINLNKYSNLEEIIFSKIENFHSKNNVLLNRDDKNEDILNIIYVQKMVDNDDYEIKIELNKNQSITPNHSNEILKLNNSFNSLTKELEEMKISFEKKLKEKEEENNNLKKLLKMTKTTKGLEPLVFESDPRKLTQCFEINEVVDGGRGMNDHFAVYNLVNDPKKVVYVAIKNKTSDSEKSYINIIKIKSVNDYSIIQTLKGHNQRIVFVKYYLDPYTDNEYLLSADKEEVVIVWKICDKNNYKRFCYINTFYGQLLMRQSIYSCIIFFTEKKNYIYTSSVTKNYSRLYELEDGSFLRNLVLTLNN